MRSPDDPSRRPDVVRPEDLPDSAGLADPDYFPNRENWLERILLPEKSAGIPMPVLIAFGLGVLSAALLSGFFCLFFFLDLFASTQSTREGGKRWLLFGSAAVHLAALIAGCLAGGFRRDGPGAARVAVIAGGVGTAIAAAVLVLWLVARQ